MWTVIEGDGYLFDVSDTAVTFVAGNPGVARIVASVDTVSFRARVTIEAGSLTENVITPGSINVFPNPY